MTIRTRAFAASVLVSFSALAGASCSRADSSGDPGDGGASGGVDANGPRTDGSGPSADGSVPTADAGADAATGAPSVRLVGRFEADGQGMRFAWTGSAMIAHFRGTTATLKLRDFATQANTRNHFTVVVDNGAPTRLDADPAKEAYVIAKDLPAGEHTVSVTRDTEAFVGEDLYLGFDFGTGTLLAPPPAPARRIDVIGDSITCGYGIEGANETCPYTTGTQNGTIAFGSLAGKALGADVVTQCWSGRGVFRNNTGDKTIANLVPALAEKTLPEKATSVWPFSAPPPDAVVVNLGTNDFYADQPIPTSAEFAGAYRAFFDKLRGHYPKAHLFAALGPMLSDTYPAGQSRLGTARTYLQSVVTAMTNAGDTRVHFIEFPIQVAADGLGCDYHPSRKTAQIMATKLQNELHAVLGW